MMTMSSTATSSERAQHVRECGRLLALASSSVSAPLDDRPSCAARRANDLAHRSAPQRTHPSAIRRLRPYPAASPRSSLLISRSSTVDPRGVQEAYRIPARRSDAPLASGARWDVGRCRALRRPASAALPAARRRSGRRGGAKPAAPRCRHRLQAAGSGADPPDGRARALRSAGAGPWTVRSCRRWRWPRRACTRAPSLTIALPQCA